MTDPYEILGLTPDATLEEVKKAYKMYVSKFHPDKHDGDPFFDDLIKRVNEAYNDIANPGKTRRRSRRTADSGINGMAAEIERLKTQYARALENAQKEISRQMAEVARRDAEIVRLRSETEKLKAQHEKDRKDMQLTVGGVIVVGLMIFLVVAVAADWINPTFVFVVFAAIFIIMIVANINRIANK
jgi:curved DNA-binding protein CbpA